MQSNEMVPVKPMDRFKQELAMREGHLRSLLPQAMTVDKFQGIVVAAVADNMDLLGSILGSMTGPPKASAEVTDLRSYHIKLY